MAYDDIRISELPSLPELHANDLILVQDVTNNLAHRIDWGRLKNSLGTLSKGITFPLGTEQQPEIAIGDHTSGIMAEDYGTFVIVTHGEKRFKINQAGTIELINGNVVIGNFDRQCAYALIINNITTFNCYASFTSGADIDGNLNVTGNITGGKKFNVPGDVILGTDCENSLVINGEIFGKCNMDLKGNMAIHKNITVDESATILRNVSLGSSCIDKFDVYSDAWFRCNLRVDGDLTFGGDLVLDGDVNIGGGCSNQINLHGTTIVYCDLRVKGETYLEQNLYVNKNTAIDANLFAKEDTILGIGCQYTTTINSTLTVECTSFFRGDVTIGDPSLGCPGTHLQVNGDIETPCDVLVHKDLVVDHNTTLGTDCNDDLLVKATPVFLCDAEFRKTVNVTDKLFVGGDFTADSHLVEIGDNRGCTNPNIINLNGEVHIECDLFVSGTVLYDGDLRITGPNITIGAGCGSSNINLQGYTIAHCDMLIKGDIAPYALTVSGNTEIQTNLEVRGTFDVAGDSAHDSNLFVHLDTLLNLPVPAHEYWEQCVCIDEVIATRPNRDLPQTTFIHGTQRSLCQVYLNDPRWYKPCEGDIRDGNNASEPHVQNTSIYGHLNSRSNVDLNSATADSATINHKQITNVWAKLHQYSLVELNKGIDNSTSACGFSNIRHTTHTINFNDHDNEEHTIIYGDLYSKKNVLLNSSCDHLTQVMGKFQTQCNVYLNGDYDSNNNDANCNKLTKIQGVQESFCDVYLNGQKAGYPSNTYKDCGKETIVWGKLYASCDQEFGNKGSVCDHTTTLHTNLMQDALVELNKSGGCCGPSTPNFGNTSNNACTIIHGDTDIRASVILNTGCSQLTMVKGKFETNCDVKLNSGCGNNTEIRGVTNMRCDAYVDGFLDVKGNITGHSNLQIDKNANIDGTLDVTKDITGHANLLIEGNITGNANLIIKGNSTLGSGCTNTTTINSTLAVKCNSVFDKDLNVGGNTILGTACPGSLVTMKAKTLLKATELAGSLKAGTLWGGTSSGTGVSFTAATEGMGLTSTLTKEGCATPPTWSKIVNSVVCKSGGALTSKTDKTTGHLELDVAVCDDGGVVIDPTCGLAIDCDKVIECVEIPDCLQQKKIYANTAVFKKNASAQRPTIIMGASTMKFVGLNGDTDNNIFTVSCGPMNDEGKCGGVADKGNENDNILMRISKGGNFTKLNYIQSGGSSGGGNIRLADRNQLAVVPDLVIPPPDCGSCPDSDPNVLSFSVDNIIDAMTGGPETTSTSLTSGIFEFVFHKGSLERTLDGPIPYYPNFPIPNVDTDKLAEIHPSLCHWTWTEDSYDTFIQSDGVEDIRLKENEADRIPKPSGPNKASLMLLSLAALGIHKRRIASLTAELDELKSKPKFDVANMVDATDDTGAAAAGVDVGEMYRNGSQLMIRVS